MLTELVKHEEDAKESGCYETVVITITELSIARRRQRDVGALGSPHGRGTWSYDDGCSDHRKPRGVSVSQHPEHVSAERDSYDPFMAQQTDERPR